MEAILEAILAGMSLAIYGRRPDYPAWPRQILRLATLGGLAALSLLQVLPAPPVPPQSWWLAFLLLLAIIMMWGEYELDNGHRWLALLCIAMLTLTAFLVIRAEL